LEKRKESKKEGRRRRDELDMALGSTFDSKGLPGLGGGFECFFNPSTSLNLSTGYRVQERDTFPTLTVDLEPDSNLVRLIRALTGSATNSICLDAKLRTDNFKIKSLNYQR
jgi:hypothetical protein